MQRKTSTTNECNSKRLQKRNIILIAVAQFSKQSISCLSWSTSNFQTFESEKEEERQRDQRATGRKKRKDCERKSANQRERYIDGDCIKNCFYLMHFIVVIRAWRKGIPSIWIGWIKCIDIHCCNHLLVFYVLSFFLSPSTCSSFSTHSIRFISHAI